MLQSTRLPASLYSISWLSNHLIVLPYLTGASLAQSHAALNLPDRNREQNRNISRCVGAQNAHWAKASQLSQSNKMAQGATTWTLSLSFFIMFSDTCKNIKEQQGKEKEIYIFCYTHLHYQDDHAYGSQQMLVFIQPFFHLLKTALQCKKKKEKKNRGKWAFFSMGVESCQKCCSFGPQLLSHLEKVNQPVK